MPRRAQPGEYWKQHYHGITIYGYAMTEKEFLDVEQALGADEEELAFQRRTFRRWRQAGRLYGRAYSIACVDGEYGSTPINQTLAITKEEFEAARKAEWTD
jgi:hypothetical protein